MADFLVDYQDGWITELAETCYNLKLSNNIIASVRVCEREKERENDKTKNVGSEGIPMYPVDQTGGHEDLVFQPV